MTSRVGIIGASQVAGALGVDPWQTPEETRQAILTGRWDDPPADPRDDRYMGRLLEPAVIRALRDELRCRWNPRADAQPWTGESIQHPDLPWLRVTPDSTVSCGPLRGFGECKCPRRLDLDRWTDPDESMPLADLNRWGVPLHYAYQGQTQMGVARAAGMPVEIVWFPVLGRAGGFDVWVVEHDDEAWAAILEPLVGWYDRHVTGGEPCPPATPQEARARFAVGGKPVVRISPHLEGALEQRARMKATMRGLVAAIARLDLSILEQVGRPSVLMGSMGLIGSYDRRGVFRPVPEWRKRHERSDEPQQRSRPEWPGGEWPAADPDEDPEAW